MPLRRFKGFQGVLNGLQLGWAATNEQATNSDSKKFKKRQLVAFLSLICLFLNFFIVFRSKI